MTRRSLLAQARTELLMTLRRGESVIVPIEPFAGTLNPLPTRMTSPSVERWKPWLAEMIRTSWPRVRRFR